MSQEPSSSLQTGIILLCRHKIEIQKKSQQKKKKDQHLGHHLELAHGRAGSLLISDTTVSTSLPPPMAKETQHEIPK